VFLKITLTVGRLAFKKQNAFCGRMEVNVKKVTSCTCI